MSMNMILNDVLTKQNLLAQLLLSSNSKELPKELKVKIMRLRMSYAKIKKQFDEEVQVFTSELIPEELNILNAKETKTEEDLIRIKELVNKVNSEYQEFLAQKGSELVSVNEEYFNMDEYADIVDINSSNDVVINNQPLKAADLLEAVYTFFVKED